MRFRPRLEFWLLALAILCAAPARSEPTIQDRLNAAFAGLDVELRTGVLYDRVLPLSGIERFDGAATSPAATRATWRQMYDELRRASIAPNTPPLAVVLLAGARRSLPGVIPIAVLDQRYERLREGALDRGEVTVSAERIESIAPGALEERHAFAATALVERTYRGAEVRFVLESDAYFSSDGPPRDLELDAGDGAGFRTLRFGKPLAAHYGETGRVTARVRARTNDGEVRTAAFTVEIIALAAPSPDDTLHVTATIPHLGQFGTGDAYVYRAPGHAAIVNPVVVVEGFDLDNTTNWDELYALLNRQNLIEDLRADGFDAVVLNFTDATDYLQKNAFVLAELLAQVQAEAGPAHTIALAGASMGGLISRYALAYLETNGPGHAVRTLISFDSPQAGADIPLGIQHWVNFFSSQSSEAAALRDILNRPAARQMLLYHFGTPPIGTGQCDALRTALHAELAGLGDYPALPRLVAIANGSGGMQSQGFAPGEQIVQYSYSNFFVEVRGNVWAVPNLASQMIFDGRTRILFTTNARSVIVSGTLPWDGAPGGTRATMAEMDAVPAPYGNIIALHPAHAFVPAISALALTTTNPFYDIAGDGAILTHTPFDAVYYPSANQEHVDITAENAVWIKNEIEAGVTAVDGAGLESGLALRSAAPNPFSRSTDVSFSLPAAGEADVRVFDVSGREIASLVRGELTAGVHRAKWDGRDANGDRVAPGVYLLRLEADGRIARSKLVRLD